MTVGDRYRSRFLGLTRGQVDHRGTYQGSWVGELRGSFNAEDWSTLGRAGLSGRMLRRVAKQVVQQVGAELGAAGYRGPFGVDAFIYERADGGLALHPLAEVNPRWTMGRLALALGRLLPAGRSGRLEIHSRGLSEDPSDLSEPLGPLAPGATLLLSDPKRIMHGAATLTLDPPPLDSLRAHSA